MSTVITDQPSVSIATDLDIPEGLPLAVITGELLELGPNKPLAQGTRLGYVITCFPDKEN